MDNIEMTDGGEGRTIHFEAPEPGADRLHWIPITRGQFIDAPVGCTNGLAYYVLPFDLGFDRIVKTLSKAYRNRGRRSARVEEIDAAIETLQTYRAELAAAPGPKKGAS